MQRSNILVKAIAVAVTIGLGGCATPQDVKDASTTQLKLIEALDDASKALGDGLNQYAADQEALILQERKVKIARVAIQKAIQGDKDAKVTFDSIYRLSSDPQKGFIRRAADLTQFHPSEIVGWDNEIERLKKVEKSSPGSAEGILAHTRINQITRFKAKYTNIPSEVKAQEDAELKALKGTDELRAVAANGVEGLRLQLALMHHLASRVNTWLNIDLSPSQTQVDSVEKTFSDLITELNTKDQKGKP